jgi:hypothetical protein
MRKRLLWMGCMALSVTCVGCSSYTASEAQLVAQARKGVAVWSAREAARDDEVKLAFDGKRKALDDAFDADARQRGGALDADWVIESRRAYAAGLASIEQQQSAALAANQAARDDAAATDAALAKLLWLLSIQSNVQTMIEKGGAQ